MLELRMTRKMLRDIKRMGKRGAALPKLDAVIETLRTGNPLPPANRDHALTGDWAGCRECHIENDWLLIYYIDENGITLVAARTGTHSDLDF